PVTHLHLLAEALLPEHTREVLLRPFFPDHPPGAPGSHPFPERFMDLVGERLVPWVTANLDRLDLPAAITAAERAGERAFGAHRAEWTWGRAHRLRLFHPFIQVPFLAPVFGRLEVGLAGDHTTPNQTAYPVGPHLPWPRQVSYLPSMRAVFDLADRQRSAVVHLTGSSGHPLSPHYDDMLPLYLENRRIPLGPGMEVREHIELAPDVRPSDGMEPERPGALSDGSGCSTVKRLVP
ncbi:MAG: penicillin acylase family protein, partial [Clostridia bacterium]